MYGTLIDTDTLRARLDDPDWMIVDCRFDLKDPHAGRRAWLEGHVPGAAYADLERDLSVPRPGAGRHPLPDAARLEAVFSRLGIEAGRQVVAYDAEDGGFAARLWWLLRYAGHDAVAVLDGGWRAWREAGLAQRAGEERPPPARFRAALRPERIVGAAQVPSVPRLVDARDPARYRGELEPLDPVAGHIPGAVSHCFRRNLDARGRFLPPARLRAQLEAVLAGCPAQEAVFYCGSGVTACHNLLALAHAGLPEGRLYPGSWSEWCSDPARPVATGDES